MTSRVLVTLRAAGIFNFMYVCISFNSVPKEQCVLSRWKTGVAIRSRWRNCKLGNVGCGHTLNNGQWIQGH